MYALPIIFEAIVVLDEPPLVEYRFVYCPEVSAVFVHVIVVVPSP